VFLKLQLLGEHSEMIRGLGRHSSMFVQNSHVLTPSPFFVYVRFDYAPLCLFSYTTQKLSSKAIEAGTYKGLSPHGRRIYSKSRTIEATRRKTRGLRLLFFLINYFIKILKIDICLTRNTHTHTRTLVRV